MRHKVTAPPKVKPFADRYGHTTHESKRFRLSSNVKSAVGSK